MTCYSQVFFKPETVMTKFVSNIYVGALSSYINGELEALRGNMEQYLEKLSALYASTTQLSQSLSETLKFGSDTSFLMKLTQNKLFGAYLSKYKEYVSTPQSRDCCFLHYFGCSLSPTDKNSVICEIRRLPLLPSTMRVEIM